MFKRAAVQPSSKVILPYEADTGHWEAEKRRKETREWLRKREQQVRDRMNTPSIVPAEPGMVSEPEKNHIR
jgi:hypothetical protein